MPDDTPRTLKRFGPFGDAMGVRMVEWALDRCVLELDVGERHLNGLGVVHGGVVTTLIDMACAHAGIYCTVPGNRRYGMTASLTVNLMGSVRSGRIRVEGRKRGGGKTLYMASGEAYDQEGALVAMGEAVCRYARGSEAPEGVPATEMAMHEERTC